MARRQVNIFINGREVANQMKSIQKEKRKVTRELNNMTIGTQEYEDKVKELRKINDVIDGHRKKIRNVESSWTKVSAGALKFGAIAAVGFAADAIVEYGAELFQLGTEMEVMGKKARTVFGETFDFVEQQAQKNAAAMGLTRGEYIDAAAAIGDLLIPMGFQRQEAADISTNLVDLSGALSEWTGGQISATEVTDVLGKAMLGEREQLKSLGIAISEADVQNRLAEKGLKGLTGEMLQQAKAAATLELITEKSADAQAAYAANSDTLVRKQAELSARFGEIKESIAAALIPVFHRLMEVAEPVVTTLAELVNALISGEKVTGEFSGATNIMASVIRNAWKMFQLLLGIVVKVGSYLFTKLAPVIEFIGTKVLQFYNILVDTVNGLQDLVDIDVGKLEPIDISDFQKSIKEAKKSIENAGLEEDISVDVTTRQNTVGGSDQDLQAAAQAAEAAKRREKEAERAAKAQQKKLERLLEIQAQFEEQSRLQALSAEDRKIAELSAKFDEQIQKAKELEAQGVAEATAARLELERLKEQQVNDLREELDQAAFDAKMAKEQERTDAEIEANLERIQQQADAEKEFRDFLKKEKEATLAEARALELEALELQYEQMVALAKQHGLDLDSLLVAYRQKKSAINAKFDKEDRAQETKAQQETLKALQKSYSDAASVISSTMDTLAAIGVKNAGLQKALALAEIGINTAKAIAAGIASASSVPFPGNIAAIAATIATVVANMASASKILSGTQIPQKKKGGWFGVTGQDDNTTYNAKYIGSPSSGMLPSHPVVLASEAGAEYFVANKDLQNPYVLNHVRAIENITRGRRMTQFNEGGFSEGEVPVSAGNGQSTEVSSAMISVMGDLVSVLERGIVAVIDDDTIVDIRTKFNELNNAAGGTLE